MEPAITLLSGGIDSYLSTHLAGKKCKVLLALTFDYGQRAAVEEIQAAQKMARRWRIRHQTVELPWLKTLGESALTQKQQRLPQFIDPAKLKSKRACDRSAEVVWVPNRNGVFINIAAAFAESLGAVHIITGFNREEALTFPDNSDDYARRISRALELSTLLYPPKVKSYVQEMDKKEMVKKFLEEDLSVDLFWSCYEAGPKMCGTCESCARTLAAFRANHLENKIGYRFKNA